MEVLDLQLQIGQRDGELTVFMQSPTQNDSFQVAFPFEAIEWQQEWRRQFLAFHDPANTAVTADAVSNFGTGLHQALSEWLALSECDLLRQSLSNHPGLPLRLSFTGEDAARLEQLPWELIFPDRNCWRLIKKSEPNKVHIPKHSRRPRILVIAGETAAGALDQELDRLRQLSRQGRIDLELLNGSACTLVALREQLSARQGWDALFFLGHSERDPTGGGRMLIGDGSWVTAAAFADDLRKAASNGLSLALFNSCSGLDLARSSVIEGVQWALCFREPVPCVAASRAFSELLASLERGSDLFTATQKAKHLLISDPASSGTDLLLSLVGAPTARRFQLPLRKRKQFLLRLASSTKAQALIAGVLVALGGAADIDPANPINSYLLDRRLYFQRTWRSMTNQRGPDASSLPVVVLDKRSSQLLEVADTPGRVPRLLLAKVLELVPPNQVSKVGLDVVLDEPAPHTSTLANVIRQQNRAEVIAGFLGENSAGDTGVKTRPVDELIQVGLQAKDLSTGTPTNGDGLKWTPLQLWEEVNKDNFAGAMSSVSSPRIPVDAVLDWSIDWKTLIERVEISQLPTLKAESLLVGTDGTLDRDGEDLFRAPGAMDPELTEIWQGARRKVPGVLIQAVLTQSLNLQHWLKPASQAFTTALASGLGVLIAAAQISRRRRFLIVGVVSLIAIPLCWQVAVTHLWLIALVLPLAALFSAALVRTD